MYVLKKYTFVAFVVLYLLSSVVSVKINPQNETADFLWKLYNLALQGRQFHTHPYSYKYPGKYPEYYQKYANNPYQYPGSTYPSFHNKKPYAYKLPSKPYYVPQPDPENTYPGTKHPFYKPKESVMDVLHSIARNDDLQCVPKLICEVTSGTISGRQQGLNLPVNVNMESLLGFLSLLKGAQSSPLLYFGKAALLGFTSRGNTGTCNYAYPECPSDPDRVVKYLNNHNGGFFRFFNGGVGTQIPHWRKPLGEERIQNDAVDYIPNNFQSQNSITFPKEEYYPNVEIQQGFRSEKTLRFPSKDYAVNQNTNDLFYSHNSLKFPNEDYEHSYRKPKELYCNDQYDLDIQKPLPNHKAVPMIFPVRTGTGDLRLDPEELQDYRKPVSSYDDDDVRIVFNTYGNEQISYDRNAKRFSFPQ